MGEQQLHAICGALPVRPLLSPCQFPANRRARSVGSCKASNPAHTLQYLCILYLQRSLRAGLLVRDMPIAFLYQQPAAAGSIY
jgi:hypothetical protein